MNIKTILKKYNYKIKEHFIKRVTSSYMFIKILLCTISIKSG